MPAKILLENDGILPSSLNVEKLFCSALLLLYGKYSGFSLLASFFEIGKFEYYEVFPLVILKFSSNIIELVKL